MPTLFVHVGHNKTGSSFIQSSLALSLDNLHSAGIAYPEYSTLQTAAQGLISSGNGALLLNSEQTFDAFTGPSVLLSNETLFISLLTAANADRLHQVAQQIGAEQIKILLITRDPIDHASSMYQQKIKRGGFTDSIDGLYEEYAFPQLVADFLTHPQLGAHPNVDVTLRNYSHVSSDLIGVVSEWLRTPPGTLQEPPFAVVNRSMTAAELEFQRVVNQSLGPSGGLVSDQLCNFLPDIPSDKVIPARVRQKELLDRLDSAMNFVDNCFPAGEQYNRGLAGDPTEQERGTALVFTQRQVEVIGTSVAQEIKDLRRKAEVKPPQVCVACASPTQTPEPEEVQAEFSGRLKPAPGQQPADVLREVALGFESIGDIGTAYAIMNKAHHLRPKGKFIRQKCDEYERRLAAAE